MFRGTFFHTLDDKGRVAIPRKFRDLLPAAEGEARVVVTKSAGPAPRTLDVYPMEEWKALEDRIRQMPQFQERTRKFKRLYLHPAQELTLDSQGRILLPHDLRSHIDLGKDAVFTGDLEKFLIWSRSDWEAQQNADQAAAADGDSLDDLGL
ncbi:MAG TPA: division/cell wall cluster transcriptional repressor MraZ [Candidatus Limnocylindrales bacterium]|nr:division/cell wall cluster transcriptional repressor MraZ [Candidatus Limnocylindrales bacterium]